MKKFLIGVAATGLMAASAVAVVPPADAAAPPAKAPAAASAKGRLTVKIAGVGQGKVKVRGNGVVRTLTSTRTFTVRSGWYRVRAFGVSESGVRYVASQATVNARVRRGHAATAVISYAPVGKQTRQGILASPAPTGALGEVFTLMNDVRARGTRCGATWMPAVPAVTYNDDLAQAAARHAQDMATKDYFSHDSLDGRSFVDRIQATAYAGDPGGENIASGFQTAADVVAAWIESPGHCVNMMDADFDNVGLGLASRDDARYVEPVTYWVQDFGYDPASY